MFVIYRRIFEHGVIGMSDELVISTKSGGKLYVSRKSGGPVRHVDSNGHQTITIKGANNDCFVEGYRIGDVRNGMGPRQTAPPQTALVRPMPPISVFPHEAFIATSISVGDVSDGSVVSTTFIGKVDDRSRDPQPRSRTSPSLRASASTPPTSRVRISRTSARTTPAPRRRESLSPSSQRPTTSEYKALRETSMRRRVARSQDGPQNKEECREREDIEREEEGERDDIQREYIEREGREQEDREKEEKLGGEDKTEEEKAKDKLDDRAAQRSELLGKDFHRRLQKWFVKHKSDLLVQSVVLRLIGSPHIIKDIHSWVNENPNTTEILNVEDQAHAAIGYALDLKIHPCFNLANY